jgi:23S rRNA pseudouridine2605 synthase
MQRVQKLLSHFGYCSRRKGEELIIEGRVKINDKLITIGDKANEDDEIKVDDKVIKNDQKRYLIFHKPMNCVTAVTDKQYKTVMEYIDVKERVFPVGRLDFNTTGLLLLTNDGDFSNNITHPRYEVTKTYEAVLDRDFENRDHFKLEHGIKLDDGKTSPAKATFKGSKVSVTIHEGKKRIVRRMMKTLGYKVKSLHRSQIGNLKLGRLKEGTFRDLREEEKKMIFQN